MQLSQQAQALAPEIRAFAFEHTSPDEEPDFYGVALEIFELSERDSEAVDMFLIEGTMRARGAL